MNQQAFQNVGVSAQMRTSHRARLIQMRKGSLGEFRPSPSQASAAGAAHAAAIPIDRSLGVWCVGPIAPAAVGFRDIRPNAHRGQVDQGGVAVVPLKAAMRAELVTRNVATLVSNKPHAPEGHDDVLANVWEAHEARQFLMTAKAAGPQQAAFYSLALDTGMRKAELCGSKWSDLGATGRLTVRRQLVKPGSEPIYGPVKNKTPRQLELGAETLNLLREHRRLQAELKLRNRQHYHDHGLIFAKEWGDRTRRYDTLGDPLQMNNLGQREYAKLITASGVRRIKFHGMRHTCATLLLQAGVPAHVVQKRLGHKRIEMTLSTYAHALPSMQQDAADRLAEILHH